MTALQRLAAVFVTPVEARPEVRRASGLAVASVTVVGGPEAAVAAAGIARACASAGRTRVALVCVVGAPLPPAALRAPGLPAAAAVAAKLRARGHTARASGRAVLVLADGDELSRVLAATQDRELPVVVACCAGRTSVAEARICDSDAVVVTTAPGDEPLIADLAVAGLRAAAPGTAVVAAAVHGGRFAPRPRAAVMAALAALG